MLIQANLKAACTLLDFPTLTRFIEELKTQQYDVIGISSIMTNLQKVRKMVRLVNKHQPNAKVVIGGHISNIAALEKWTGADYIARGDGIQWLRRFTPMIRVPILPRICGCRIGRSSSSPRYLRIHWIPSPRAM